MLQAQNYLASLNKIAFSKSATSGSMQFVAVFTLTHEPGDGAWASIDPTERSVYLSMSGGAKPYTMKKLKALGIGIEGPPLFKTEGEEKLVVLPPDINAQAIELECRHETYNGEARERWELTNWGGGGNTGQAATDEDAAKLGAMWQ